ncbi:MAG: LacI family DNA-binding transcriptional regulator [Propionibacterium sp.]|nr:LacI family DNA-binding transcriptional regulator [Propionibacterium sp.]
MRQWPGPNQTPRLGDVATLAGISPTTVSPVLNNRVDGAPGLASKVR